MNEGIFALHIAVTAVAALLALRLGRAALLAWIGLQAVLANLFVIKQMTLIGLTVTCSDIYMVGSVLCLNLLQEFYGREAARQSVLISLLLMALFGVMSQLHLAYEPSPYDSTHSYFAQILAFTPRLLIASYLVFYIVQRLDIWVFGRLRARLGSWPLPLRSGLSTLLAQIVDCTLFVMIGLYDIVNEPLHVIFVGCIVKMLVIAGAVPFTALAARVFDREVTA